MEANKNVKSQLILTLYFSGKKGHHSCNKLFAVSSSGNRVLFVSQSYPGSINDNEIVVREGGMAKRLSFASGLEKDEIVIADEGFQDLYEYGNILSVCKSNLSDSFAASVRIRVENLFAKLKVFRALKSQLRIPIDKPSDNDHILGEHHKRWIIGCGFVNLDYIIF